MARTSASTILQASIKRWPIVLVAALVVGAAALGYALLTTEGPSQEATSAVRVEAVLGVPTVATVDMGIANAKSASTLQSAIESAGVDPEAVVGATAYVDPNDVQLVRIAVNADDPETAEAVADAMGEQVRAALLAVLEPDLSFNRDVAEENEARVAQVEEELAEIEARLESGDFDEDQRWALQQVIWSLRGQVWNYGDRAQSTRYNVDKYEGVATVEGQAVAIEVSQSDDIIALTIQGLFIGAIAGIAVAFLLGYRDSRAAAAEAAPAE